MDGNKKFWDFDKIKYFANPVSFFVFVGYDNIEAKDIPKSKNNP